VATFPQKFEIRNIPNMENFSLGGKFMGQLGSIAIPFHNISIIPPLVHVIFFFIFFFFKDSSLSKTLLCECFVLLFFLALTAKLKFEM